MSFYELCKLYKNNFKFFCATEAILSLNLLKVFLNNSNNVWGINDRFFTDYTKTVSFDKYSWLSELNN